MKKSFRRTAGCRRRLREVAARATARCRFGLAIAAAAWLGTETPALHAASGTPHEAVAQDRQDDGAARAATSQTGEGSVVVRAVAAPVEVDGVLDDAAWVDAARVRLVYEVAPAENAAAEVSTECRLAVDEAHLYFGCEALDPDPASIRAYHAARDGTAGHDRILLTLDPFADGRRAYRFGVSALGVPLDAVVAQQGGAETGTTLVEDVAWDALWTAAARITADGYVVEAAIPFRSLRFPSEVGTWRYFITRERPRRATVELRSTELDRSNGCVLCQSSTLSGLEGATGGRALLLSPTLTATRSGAATPDRGDVQAELGLDGTLALTTDLTLAAALNPDFSQVESDAAQLEANARFALFYPEQRPFFLEGADLFATPLPVLFTRTVADPVAGAKLTGKRGGTAVGAMVAHDRLNQRIVPGSQASSYATSDGRATTAAVRVQRDVGTSSTVGAVVTAREAAGAYHNRVAGVDALLRPIPALTVTAQAVRTWTRDPAAPPGGEGPGAGSGDALYGHVRYAPRDWVVDVNGQMLDRTTRFDAGYQPTVGVRSGQASLGRRFWGGADRWFERLSLSAGVWYQDEIAGPVLNRGVWVGMTYIGPLQSRLAFYENTRALLRVGDRAFPVYSHYLEASIRPISAIELGLHAWAGQSVDFANEAPAYERYIGPSVDARIGRRLAIRLSAAVQALDDDRGALLRESVTDARATFHFTSRARLRATVVHRDTRRDAATNPAALAGASRTLAYQLVYAWEPSARTLVYAGFDERRAGEPFAPPERTFFLKVGYAIQH